MSQGNTLTTLCSACGFGMAEGSRLRGLCPRCLLGSAQSEVQITTNSGAPLIQIPEIEILDVIGQGGTGQVFRAHQASLDREVAIKILAPHLTQRAGFVERFKQEGKALAGLSHPNIVSVYSVGNVDRTYYIIMEYVDGINLGELIAQRPLERERAFEIVYQICNALEYAHAKGIVHRDIKPENILIPSTGPLKLADFGLTKLIEQVRPRTRLTQTADVMGTPYYIAPEQLTNSSEIGTSADIFSLAVVFYEMLFSELPIGRFAPPSERDHALAALDGPILKALQSNPRERYQTVYDLRQDLKRAEQGSGEPPARVPKKSTLVMVLTFICIALAISIAPLFKPSERPLTTDPGLTPLYFRAGEPDWAWTRLPEHKRSIWFEPLGPDHGFSNLNRDGLFITQLKLAGRSYSVVSEPARDRLYIDANGNFDLSDDGLPFQLGESSDKDPMPIGDITFLVSYGSDPNSAAEPLLVGAAISRDRQLLHLTPKSYRTGKFVENGEARSVFLLDARLDGTFSNDILIIDLNENFQIDQGETIAVGDSLELGDVGYRLDRILQNGQGVIFRRKVE